MVKIHCRHVRNFPIKDKNILLKSRILHSIFTVLSIIRSTVLSKTVNKNQGLLSYLIFLKNYFMYMNVLFACVSCTQGGHLQLEL